MDNTCTSGLRRKLTIALYKRGLSQERFSQYSCNPNYEISRLYKNNLFSELMENEIHIKYLTLLYQDSGIEIDLNTSKNAEKNIYEQAIENTLYSTSEAEFLEILDKNPHEQIYSNYIYGALHEMHKLKEFYNIKNPIDITDNSIDEHIKIMNNIFSKPALALKGIVKLKKEKDISSFPLNNLTNNIMKAFEYEYIIPSEKISNILEEKCEEEFRPNITISATPEKLELFKETIQESIKKLAELKETVEKINIANFMMTSKIVSPLKGFNVGDINKFPQPSRS